MKRLPVIEHLPTAEIAQRYRICPDEAKKTRRPVLWLATRPDQPRSVGPTASRGRPLLKSLPVCGPCKGHRLRSNGQSKFGFTHPATNRTRALIPPKAKVNWTVALG